MAQRDLTEKNLEYYPDVFADIINTLLYGGKPTLTAAGLQPAPTETLYPGTSACLRNQFQDVSKYEMDAERVKIQYTIENETKAKRKMILRKAGYEYIDNSRLHVFEMSRLPADTRKLFQSDMRIVADYLAEEKIMLLPVKGFSIWKHYFYC